MDAAARAITMPASSRHTSSGISWIGPLERVPKGAVPGAVWHTVASVEPCDFAVGSSAWRE